MEIFHLPKQEITDEDLAISASFFDLKPEVLLEYQLAFEEHVNSPSIQNTLKAVLQPLEEAIDILTGDIRICGYAPVGQPWEECFATTSILGVMTSTCGTSYLLINLNLFTHLSVIDKIVSIAHEKVHLKQIKDGRLSISSTNLIWEGEDWSERNVLAKQAQISNDDQTAYRNLPWEKEAYAFEDKFRVAYGKITQTKIAE